MLTRKRRIVGLGILVAGFCAAIPYQRRARDSQPAGLNETVASSLRLSDQPLQLSMAARSPVDADSPIQGLEDQHRIRPLRIEAHRDQTQPASAPRGQGPVLPNIDDRFPVSGRPVVPSSTVSLRITPIDDELPLIAPAQRRSHRVRDGDTLALLAEHYLGHAERADEIYQLNRQRLSSAELLPLGTVLEIPTN